MIMEKEEEEEELFTEWPAEEREQESTEDEDDEKEMETEREKSGLDILRPSVSLANRRASLPCPVSSYSSYTRKYLRVILLFSPDIKQSHKYFYVCL